jgi:hypothetical protein
MAVLHRKSSLANSALQDREILAVERFAGDVVYGRTKTGVQMRGLESLPTKPRARPTKHRCNRVARIARLTD